MAQFPAADTFATFAEVSRFHSKWEELVKTRLVLFYLCINLSKCIAVVVLSFQSCICKRKDLIRCHFMKVLRKKGNICDLTRCQYDLTCVLCSHFQASRISTTAATATPTTTSIHQSDHTALRREYRSSIGPQGETSPGWVYL